MAAVFHNHGQALMQHLEEHNGQAVDLQQLFTSFTLASFAGLLSFSFFFFFCVLISPHVQRLHLAKSLMRLVCTAPLQQPSTRPLAAPIFASSFPSLVYANYLFIHGRMTHTCVYVYSLCDSSFHSSPTKSDYVKHLMCVEEKKKNSSFSFYR